RLGEGELDEAALAGGERQALRAAAPSPKQGGALAVDGVEASAHDVKRRRAVRPGVEHPDPHPLANLRLERVRIVLARVAVERHDVRPLRLDGVDVDGSALLAEVELRL